MRAYFKQLYEPAPWLPFPCGSPGSLPERASPAWGNQRARSRSAKRLLTAPYPQRPEGIPQNESRAGRPDHGAAGDSPAVAFYPGGVIRSGAAQERRGAADPLAGRPFGGGPFPQPGRGTERLYFSTSLLNRFISPVVLALDQNERSMWPALWPNDLVLLDRSPIERRRPDFEHVYALSWAGEGWVGRCRVVGGALVVVVDNARQAHSLHGPVPLERKEVLDIVRGKIVWVGRELDVV